MSTRHLPDDIIFELLKHMDFEDLKNFCSQNKDFQQFCFQNKNTISKIFLTKYQVDYKDQSNYIYVAHNANINDYKNSDGTWNYPRLLALYAKSYSLKTIEYTRGMTSFPIYPNMTKFHGPDNYLSTFPVQPIMENCEISYNHNLQSFPIQPRMKIFSGEELPLTSFPVQPKMTHFYGDNMEKLTSFPIQPKMTHFYGNDMEKLTSFPIQPKMTHFYAENSRINNMPHQPNLEECVAPDAICNKAFDE